MPLDGACVPSMEPVTPYSRDGQVYTRDPSFESNERENRLLVTDESDECVK